MKKQFLLVLVLMLISGINYPVTYAQVLDQTGFETYADETEYTITSWRADGFTVPWVNGFNQSRAFVDDAFARSGTKSLRITYPANTFGPTDGGAQAPLMVTPANELYMSYWVRFSDNFDWGGTSEGGKLPGLGGGGRCSGCTVCTGSNGFTARLMWRPGGKAVLYLYHMEADKANGPCGDNDALQLTTGTDFYFQKGQWYNIIQRVKVNTATSHDGEVQLWINGQQALLRTGIQFVSNGDKVDNLYFSTFHGGSTSVWAPSVDCYTWFDDIKIAATWADVAQDGITTDIKNSAAEKFAVYPNPSSQDFTVSAHAGSFTVSLYNAAGQLLSVNTYNAATHIGEGLPAGIYVIRIEQNGIAESKKVIKQ
ncbi:T9SS type A sorting domain-containing protein [Cytophaga hutchinsonii]|nr:T9SS type A sorting domain-containing protein [Cytophaga hutchinsonii]SFX93240.1 Por secretion system C-terminal sorting domain-containing protein [Cytophaga hutchinsonii ATCC 33406]